MNGKKLTRSRTNRMIGGVAAGIAQYLNVDPVIFRILFVFLIPFGGAGLIIYLIMLIVMPEDQSPLFATQEGEADTVNGEAYVVDEEGNTVCDAQEGATSNQQDVFKGFVDMTKPSKERKTVGLIVGILLILLGCYIFILKFFSLSWFKFMFPLLLLITGVIIIIVSIKSKNKGNA